MRHFQNRPLVVCEALRPPVGGCCVATFSNTSSTSGLIAASALDPWAMLLEIIIRGEVHFAQRNLFDCARGQPFSEGIAQGPSMFEAITAFLIVMSVGILIAHALDAFRPWS